MSPVTFSIADVLGPLNDFERKYAPPQLYWSGDISLLKTGPEGLNRRFAPSLGRGSEAGATAGA